ncbi:MAG: hypothetical protein ACK41D_03675 [Rubricoccaceae bacterium]
MPAPTPSEAFVHAVLEAAGTVPSGALTWAEINGLAARWLRPAASAQPADTSREGHALVAQLVSKGIIEAELTRTAGGAVIVRRVLGLRSRAFAA